MSNQVNLISKNRTSNIKYMPWCRATPAPQERVSEARASCTRDLLSSRVEGGGREGGKGREGGLGPGRRRPNARSVFCSFGCQGRLFFFLPDSFEGVGRPLLETHLLHRSLLRSHMEPILDQKMSLMRRPFRDPSGICHFPFRELPGLQVFDIA